MGGDVQNMRGTYEVRSVCEVGAFGACSVAGATGTYFIRYGMSLLQAVRALARRPATYCNAMSMYRGLEWPGWMRSKGALLPPRFRLKRVWLT